MRVIGGTAKGRRLLVPKGQLVRPTAARVKESLFNILPRHFSGMKVLDLFSGTGNVSIEALSRGAASALLIDASARSARTMRENLARLGFGESSTVWVAPVSRALRALAKRGDTFDMIFLDPPYEQGLVGASLKLIAQGHLLSASGIVVGEHSARETIKSSYDALVQCDQRRYGDTLLSFFKQAVNANSSR
jgi:16S rRNA (guanine(966)-N(2))-methyltransferase RsmD